MIRVHGEGIVQLEDAVSAAATMTRMRSPTFEEACGVTVRVPAEA
jgi:hypothetical protein